jgi:GntR family transcriptional regulator
MSDENAAMGFRPLYAQVRDELARRLAEGHWQPGDLLPSEHELARELGVSQGTVRKALNAMTDERILVRRQGRGTFVAAFGEARILFQFYHLAPDSGERVFPQSRFLERVTRAATMEEAEALGVAPEAAVHVAERIRGHGETPVLVETIALPLARFPGIDDLAELPNNVYGLYAERWGVSITGGEERLKAVPASARDAPHLGCAPGTALLYIERVARDIRGEAVEFRRSRCLTVATHYARALR